MLHAILGENRGMTLVEGVESNEGHVNITQPWASFLFVAFAPAQLGAGHIGVFVTIGLDVGVGEAFLKKDNQLSRVVFLGGVVGDGWLTVLSFFFCSAGQSSGQLQ